MSTYYSQLITFANCASWLLLGQKRKTLFQFLPAQVKINSDWLSAAWYVIIIIASIECQIK